MYIPSHFSFEERQAQLAFIKQYSFASLITSVDGQLTVNQFPFLLDESGEFLLAHCAKANFQWQMLEKAQDLMVCFNGPNAYISPNWYCDSIKNVPTWNYLSVQVRGKASLLGEAELVELLDRLSQIHESQFPKPWTIDKLDQQQLSRMLKGIVGFKISIDQIEGKAKLSQNKSREERNNLIEGLSTQKDFGGLDILDWMRLNID